MHECHVVASSNLRMRTVLQRLEVVARDESEADEDHFAEVAVLLVRRVFDSAAVAPHLEHVLQQLEQETDHQTIESKVLCQCVL